MSALIAAAVSGVAFCFCTATASLCSSWCGNDKPSSIPPGANSGRKRSVLLLALSVVVALIFQYAVAPRLQPDRLTAYTPYIGEYLINAWTAGCTQSGSAELLQVCSGNSGVYRASFAAFIFFCIFGLAAYCRPTANREAWVAKYVLFLFFCIGTVFISNDPLFLPIYLNIARVGGSVFSIFQQVILVDVAYNWNESWLAKADKAEGDEGPGKGKKWLAAILAACAILFIGSIVGIILLYIYFGGCSTNNAFISITLLVSLLCTVVQLKCSESGSLLSSACMTAYATYLCGVACSKNSNPLCNPKLGETSVGNIILGLLLATMSLLWTGYSSTANKRVGGRHEDEDITQSGEVDETPKVGGLVVDGSYGSAPTPCEPLHEDQRPAITSDPTFFNNSWKLNAILGLICCWYAMALTGWGTVERRGNIANPDVSEVSMWMLIASQWVALSLYLWTLVAPSLCPGRDFS
ncbi:hypothetical protein HJC23_011320 [Cyclotella cryptica]|uniref:Serine incorporator n=1 Tax=Cyclotella cryptica TaxID=29204 RepID=A0ABD3QVT9_9STRA